MFSVSVPVRHGECGMCRKAEPRLYTLVIDEHGSRIQENTDDVHGGFCLSCVIDIASGFYIDAYTISQSGRYK